MTTSTKSTTWGWVTNAAIRSPPRRCGLTTRSAPTRSSLASEDSPRARAMTWIDGLKDRLATVTNRLSASVSRAAIRVPARSMPARSSVSSSVTSPDHDRRARATRSGRGPGRPRRSAGRRCRGSGATSRPTRPQPQITTCPVHGRDVPVHPSPPDQFPHVSVDEQFQRHGEGVERRADPEQDEDDGERLHPGPDRVGEAVADRRHGDHRLVDGLDAARSRAASSRGCRPPPPGRARPGRSGPVGTGCGRRTTPWWGRRPRTRRGTRVGRGDDDRATWGDARRTAAGARDPLLWVGTPSAARTTRRRTY